MKNSIVISAEFFFKGQKLSPSLVVDLDAYIKNHSTPTSILPLLAKNNNIDLYSYEYEVLQSEPLIFSNATGLAEQFLSIGGFDFEAFTQAWNDQRILDAVSHIASTHLSVDDLSAQPELKSALIEAFKLGQQS